MKTLQEAAETRGVSPQKDGLRVHFSPIPNWYGCCLGFTCPVCDKEVGWQWKGRLPGFTTPESIAKSGVEPVADEGTTITAWAHRYIQVKHECGTVFYVDNFDD